MFIVRLPNRDGKLHLALAVETETRAMHPEIHRTKRIIGRDLGFPMREIEGTGKFRKDQLDLKLKRDSTENELGRPPYQYEARVPMAAVSDHVRRLPAESVEPLALNAQAIAVALAEVRRLRQERAELVRAAWRRSRKSVGPAELEAIADRTAKIKEQPARALVLSDEDRAQLRKDTELLNAFAAKTLREMGR